MPESPELAIIYDMRVPKSGEMAQLPYVKSIHATLLEEQSTETLDTDYFQHQAELTPDDRKILINWLIIV